MPPKEPFERIISLVDRKKILNKVVLDNAQVICKIPGGNLIPFSALRLTPEGHLEGKLLEKTNSNAKSRLAVLFFYCGKDRYFIHTKLTRIAPYWRALPSIEFYKLNRRQAHRTEIPPNTRISYHVTSVGTQRCNVVARVLEFSAGGARIRWPGSPALDVNSILKGRIVWLKEKEMIVHALVRHRHNDGLFGLEFTNLDSVQMNRLKLMSIEIQQFVNYMKS